MSARERGQARRHQVKSLSGEGKASVTTNDRAHGGRLWQHCPFCCCIVQQGRDDDRGLVRGRWNRRCGNSRSRGGCVAVRGGRDAQPKLSGGTESRNRLRLWTRIQARRKPSRPKTREQVKRVDSEEVRKGRAKECESLMKSKSKWRSMNRKCG